NRAGQLSHAHRYRGASPREGGDRDGDAPDCAGGAEQTATMTRAEPPVPSFVLDRPVLHPFVAELVADERLQRFAEAMPTRARVSEPALPLLLAALHEHVDRGLVCALPEDADARDAAE